MLRPSPTVISLSKRDVGEHLENVVRKAASARCGGAKHSINAKFPMQPLYNRQSTFMDDARATSWSSLGIQGITRCHTGDPIRGQSDGLDVSSESRLSDGSDTDEIARMVQPLSQLLSFEDNEVSGTEDAYQLTGISPQDDNASEGIGRTQPLALRSPESRQHETPQENNLGYGVFMQTPSRDSSSFGESLSISICWMYS